MQATDSDAILSRTLATASAIQHAASTGERVHELHVVVPPAVLAQCWRRRSRLMRLRSATRARTRS